MDYIRPVEAIIPGVQGRILAVLAHTDAELTMRTVARLAEVSSNRATTVLNGLVELGLVKRRDVGTSALVQLVRENEAGRIVAQLAQVADSVLKRLAEAAIGITPAPKSVVVFGSFARGQARKDSDVDLLVVRPEGVPADDADWISTLGKWSDLAARIAGNPVNLIVVAEGELTQLSKQKRSVWAELARDGITVLGSDVRKLGAAA